MDDGIPNAMEQQPTLAKQTSSPEENTPLQRVYGRFPIAYKVSLAFGIVSVITLGIMWAILSSNLEGLLSDLSDAFGQSLAGQTANASAELILADDLLSLNTVITKVTEAPMINGAAVVDTKYSLLAQAGDQLYSQNTFQQSTNQASFSPNTPLQPSNQGIYVSPIIFKDVVAGYALIHLDKSLITESIDRSLHWMAMATLCILCISIVVALLLGKHITGPVKHLTQGTNALRNGDLNYRITQTRQDELGALIDGFNEMAQGIKERQQLTKTFQRYLDSNIANNLLSNLDDPTIPTEYVNASVLFIDIVGFTTMCETLAPKDVGELLNTYYQYTLKASSVFNGTVDKFIGDGVMIIFGAPQENKQHSFNAICSAQLFLGLVATYNNSRKKQGLPTIQFRLGIHSGEMLAGTLGSEERLQYTVIGDTVNVAARLCGLGDPGKLVISEAAYHQAGRDQRLHVQGQKLLKVKGKSLEIPTYTVDNVKAPYSDQIDTYVTQSEQHPDKERNDERDYEAA